MSDPWNLTLSSTSVKPGQRITFSGTVATPTTGTGAVSVSSSAFAGGATMTRTDPTAYSGSATVASSAKPGTYTVMVYSSAGTVSAKLTVAGGTPTPADHGGTGTGSHTSAGTENAAIIDATGSDLLPWALGTAGAMMLLGGGAYALGRGRETDRAVEARRQDRDRFVDTMARH